MEFDFLEYMKGQLEETYHKTAETNIERGYHPNEMNFVIMLRGVDSGGIVHSYVDDNDQPDHNRAMTHLVEMLVDRDGEGDMSITHFRESNEPTS